jgi:uncharacterized lipoprotein YddW (UPF0748 family)
VLIAPVVSAAPVKLIDSFTYAPEQRVDKIWYAQDQSPPVVRGRHQARGLSFRCPFGSGVDRAFWDRRVALDLSGYNGFEFDISCEYPAALRALSVYMKSGDGWYHWSGTITEPGRQILPMMKRDFKTDGRPEGWHRIEKIRISPWRGEPRDTVLTAYSLEARNNRIVLVEGTLSAPGAGEQSASRRATKRASRWLQKVGVPHDVLADEEVVSGALNRADLAVLCYNPEPPKAEMVALRRFVQRGGKLIVFYSASEELARLMHMKLGPYRKASAYGQWMGMVFEDPGRWHVPSEVFQESWNIRPVYPADSRSRVIAYWRNINGVKSNDPAWVAGEQGAWMTHILLDDDAQAKQHMLLGLVARYVPSVWPRAAWLCLHRAGRIGPYASVGEAVNAISEKAYGVVRSQMIVKMLLRQARSLFSGMLDDYEKKKYPVVVDTFYRLREVLVQAYARVQPEHPDLFCGVWDHHGLGLYPGDWYRTCRELSKLGVTAIFPNIAWGGSALYRSKYLPESDTFRRYGDQLAQCVRAANEYGMEVHAWVVCWNLQGTSDEELRQLERKGLLMETADGKVYPWLNPAHPVNQRHTLNICREIVSKYDVDGIHLDYIRFPSSRVGYGPWTRKAFEDATGVKVARWPESVLKGGAAYDRFSQWRQDLITEFVGRVREAVRREKARVKLSAAVFGEYPECAETRAQDWAAWLERGYVNFVCPMNYMDSGAAFRRLVEKQVALPRAAGKIYPGLGVTSTESQLTPDLVIEQIQTAVQAGCPGVLLFDLDPTLREKVLPLLSEGITGK